MTQVANADGFIFILYLKITIVSICYNKRIKVNICSLLLKHLSLPNDDYAWRRNFICIAIVIRSENNQVRRGKNGVGGRCTKSVNNSSNGLRTYCGGGDGHI